MGYSYEMFFDIERLSLPKGARVLDLGSQDINIGSPDVLDAVNRFIAQYADDRLPESIIGTMIEAAEIWQMAGFDHRCIDVDDRPHTLRVDLQNFVFPTELRGQFDLVTNMGTTEHLASPMVGLALMHYACKVGGAMFTDTPIFGFGNHGLANLTPKFWHQLSLFNRYKVAICRLRKCDESLFDPGNIYHSDMAYMEGLQDARNLSWIIRFVAIKQNDHAFLPPFDAVLADSDGRNEAKILMGLLRPFVLAGIWTRKEAAAAIDDHVRRRGKRFRLRREYFRPIRRLFGRL